jgi:hypothetical protein
MVQQMWENLQWVWGELMVFQLAIVLQNFDLTTSKGIYYSQNNSLEEITKF